MSDWKEEWRGWKDEEDEDEFAACSLLLEDIILLDCDAVNVVACVGVCVAAIASTGFLERFLPLCMCLSQYFESGYASFEHLHFFPSVLLHLPGSGSIFFPP